MDKTTIEAYLNGLTWKAFQEAAAGAASEDENSSSVISKMYSRLGMGQIFPSRKESFLCSFGLLITPFWLMFAKWFVAPWSYPKKARELRLTHPAEFGAGRPQPDILLMMTGAVPSIYDSFYRLLARFDATEANVAALLFIPVVKHKTADVKALRNCALVSFYDELLRSGPAEMFAACLRARGQCRRLISSVKDERLRGFFQRSRAVVRLLFMFENLGETVYRRLFARMGIRVVVDNFINGALRKVTRELGVQTVMLQHGTQWGENKEGATRDQDEVIVWGEYWRENFSRLVLPKVRITALGCPRFDAMAEASARPRDARFYQALNLRPDRWTVTFLSQSHGFTFPESTRLAYARVTKSLSELIAARKEVLNFVVKLHPRDDPADYDAVFPPELRGGVRFLKNEVPLYDLFRHTDVAISVTSTALLEAIAMDVPVVQMACEAAPDWVDFCADGGGFLIRSGAGLIEVIDQLRSEEGFREEARRRRRVFLSLWLANLGQATEKVAAHLLETLGTKAQD